MKQVSDGLVENNNNINVQIKSLSYLLNRDNDLKYRFSRPSAINRQKEKLTFIYLALTDRSNSLDRKDRLISQMTSARDWSTI